MARRSVWMVAGAASLAMLTLIAAAQPAALALAQPGLWEISGLPGAHLPVRQCVTDMALLVRFEHRASPCNSTIIRDAPTSSSVDYSCGGAGFGHSQIDLITPRSLRISTQGISGGLPFNYVLQARRVDDCPKATVSLPH